MPITPAKRRSTWIVIHRKLALSHFTEQKVLFLTTQLRILKKI
jgi:hypothetical protein